MNIKYTLRPSLWHMAMMAPERGGAAGAAPRKPTFSGTVQEITLGKNSVLHSPRPWLESGDIRMEALMRELLHNGVLEHQRQTADRIYYLTWEGIRSPRGAEIGGYTIGWTHSGFVTNMEGTGIGTYERTMDCGGPKRNTHAMIIYFSQPKAPPTSEPTN